MTPLGRRRLRSLAALALGALTAASCARTTQSVPVPIGDAGRDAAADQVLRAIFRSSVQIRIQRDGAAVRWGSGVVIGGRPPGGDAECLVLTAGHTVAGLKRGDEIYALLDRHQPSSVEARAAVASARDDESWDLALLRLAGVSCAPALAGQPPSLGDAIWVVGFPLGGEMTVGRGIVSQVSPARPGTPPRFTIDASTSHGSSGAGVFEARTGRLIGLVEAFGTTRVPIRGDTASAHIDIPMPGMTYVTPVNRIDEFLQAAGASRLLVGRQ